MQADIQAPHRTTAVRFLMLDTLQWHLTFAASDEAAIIDTLEAIEQYGRYEPSVVVKAIRRVVSLLRRCPTAKLVIGREYSPVLYVYLPPEKVDAVWAILKGTAPDYPEYGEMNVEDDRDARKKIRIWWD